MKTQKFVFRSLLAIFTLLGASFFFVAISFAGVGYELEYAEGFEDVSLKHENVKAIDYLQLNKVVEGYGDGTFRPEQNITRAEFLKIVMEVSDFEPGGEDCYKDVQDQWYAKYVCAATENELVEGYSDYTFKPEQNINFAEASKIIANVLKFSSGEESEVWFKTYIDSLEGKEAIPMSVEAFDEPLTRAQMAEMIWRIDAERTYKLSKTYADIENGNDLTSELKNFNSCTELHDYLEDNASAPFWIPEEMDVPEGAIPAAPMMAEKGGCFTSDTKILMVDGSETSIEDIKVGDKVLTRERTDSQEMVEAEVTDTFKHFVPAYLVINQDLELTPEHVINLNGHWEAAGNARVGDFMMAENGDRVKIESIERVNEQAWVYNFEVAEYHTYIANGYYVHNDKGAVGSEDYSSTNTQVAGVDEADYVKNDGKYIYYLKGDTVEIVEAYPPSEMGLVNEIKFSDDFWPSEMYVDEDTLVVIGDSYTGDYFEGYEEALVDPAYYYHDGSTKVFVYDIADRENEDLIREVTLEGDYKSSRKIGDVVYMVVMQDNYIWPWMDSEEWTEDDLTPLYVDNGVLDKMLGCEDIKYMPKQIDETNFMIVSAIPLDKGSDIESEVIVGSSSDIYASRENLYVAQEKYSWWGWYDEMDEEEETYIHKFSLDGAQIDYQGMGTVYGSVLNQFSMDEYEGNFRIATTVGDTWNEEVPSVNNVYVLDENLNNLGSIEGLAEGERIYSARFMGDRAYVVTFKETDPLFVIGLEDPSNPELLGELKIPGFSDYLHPYNANYIIGFGLDTVEADEDDSWGWGDNFAWYQGIKLAMFDVTDVNSPVQKHLEIIGDRGTSSELNYNHKALLWSTTKGTDGGALMAFPITVDEISEEVKNDPNAEPWQYGETVFQGAYIYDVNPEDGFTLRGRLSHYENGVSEDGYYWGGKSIERIIYISDYFYTISQEVIKASKITGDMQEMGRVELPSEY